MKRMKEDRPFTRYEMPIAEGMQKSGRGLQVQVDNAERAPGGSDELSRYATGERHMGGFSAGAARAVHGSHRRLQGHEPRVDYWHGDENSDRLTRV